MRTKLIVSALLAFVLSLASAVEQQRDLDVFAWPLSASRHQSLAKVSYNSTHATLQSFTPPKIPAEDDLVRVGFFHATGSWVGISTAASNFDPELYKTLILHVNTEGTAYHVGFKATDVGGSHGAGKASSKDGLTVVVKKIQEGSKVHLNKPVVLSPDGKLEEKEPEKNFFQKLVSVV